MGICGDYVSKRAITPPPMVYVMRTEYAYINELKEIIKPFGYVHPDDFIKYEYAKGKSLNVIAKILGVSFTTVRYHMVLLGVKFRSRGGANNRKKKKPNEYKISRRIKKWDVDYPCLICGKRIEVREKYHNGEGHRRYHLRCARGQDVK